MNPDPDPVLNPDLHIEITAVRRIGTHKKNWMRNVALGLVLGMKMGWNK